MKLATHGLVRKRAELCGEIEALRKRIVDAQASIEHIDHCVWLIEPEAADKPPRKRSRPLGAPGNGKTARHIIDFLRGREAATLDEIAASIAAARGVAADDVNGIGILRERAAGALRRQRGMGLTVSEVGADRIQRWRLVRKDEAGEP